MMKLSSLFPKYKTMENLSILWLGTVGGAAFAFLSQMFLPRVLGPSNYGLFSSSMALVAMFMPLAGFGVYPFLLKIFGTEGWGAVRWLTPTFRLSATMTIATAAGIAVWAFVGPHDPIARNVILLLIPVIPSGMFLELVSCRYQLEERYPRYVIWHIIQHIIRFIVIIVLFLLSVSGALLTVSVAYSLIAAAICLYGAFQLYGFIKGRIALKGHGLKPDSGTDGDAPATQIREIAVALESFPFGLAGLFHLMYFQAPIILIKYFIGNESAGYYNIAMTILMAAYLLPNTVYGKYLIPKIHRWSIHDRERLLKTYHYGNGMMLLLGCLSTLSIIILSPIMIPILFGQDMSEASAVLIFISLSIPFRFVAFSLGAFLLTGDHIKRKIAIMGFVAVVSVLLNIILIPAYQLNGAVVSAIISDIMIFVLYLWANYKYLFGAKALYGWTFRNATSDDTEK
jgi:O-antigen/teichoic acid export membrane protein